MLQEYDNFLARIKSGVSDTIDLSGIPDWICKNTRHPKDDLKDWNFKHHEYQIDILSCTAREGCARKSSQIGFSELSVRLTYALLSIMKNYVLIYVLPTRTFADTFVKGRMNPVIDASPFLRDAIDPSVDSGQLKKIGSSFLYINGSFGKNAAISVPADGLIEDEVDFCNQEVLSDFSSRLGHAMEREFRRRFSTPTVGMYGIDLSFQKSSQAYYTIKCRGCYQRVAPNFMDHVEIPGYDGNLHTFEASDIDNPKYIIQDAFLRCPECNSPLKWEDVCNPEERVWVDKYPGIAHDKKGWQINPFDVPIVNPLYKTIRQMEEYERKGSWVNFKAGLPYEDAENSFVESVIKEQTKGMGIHVPEGVIGDTVIKVADDCFVGVDIGKISHITVLQPSPHKPGKLRVIYNEQIRQDGAGYLLKRVLYICECVGAVVGVMDAGPEFSTAKAFIASGDYGRFWACEYARRVNDKLESYWINQDDEAEQIVKAARTEVINNLAKCVNGTNMEFCEGEQSLVMRKHLTSMKRIDNRNDQGEDSQVWVTTDTKKRDHYAHSLNYAYLAYLMADKGLINKEIIITPVTYTTVKPKEKSDEGSRSLVDPRLAPRGKRR